MNEKNKKLNLNIDKFIHERARLLIISYLATSEQREVAFSELKSQLDMTAGNLSVQLKNLEETGYIKINKSIENRKTITKIILTNKGYDELMQYLDEMERMIRSIR